MAGEENIQDAQAAPDAEAASPAQSDIVVTSAERVSCDGDGGSCGHPRVWLTLGTEDEVVCPYCSRRFLREQAEEDEWQ